MSILPPNSQLLSVCVFHRPTVPPAHRDPLNPFLAPAEAVEGPESPEKRGPEGMSVAVDTVGVILEAGSHTAEPGASGEQLQHVAHVCWCCDASTWVDVVRGWTAVLLCFVSPSFTNVPVNFPSHLSGFHLPISSVSRVLGVDCATYCTCTQHFTITNVHN